MSGFLFALRQLQLQILQPTSNAAAVQAVHELVEAAADAQQAQYLVSCGFHLQILGAIPPFRQVGGAERAQLQIFTVMLLHRLAMAKLNDNEVKETFLCSTELRKLLIDLLDCHGNQSGQLVGLLLSLLCCFAVSSRPDEVYVRAAAAECLKPDSDPSKRRLLQAVHEQVLQHGVQDSSIVISYCELLQRSMSLDLADEMDAPLRLHELVISLVSVYPTRREVLIPLLALTEEWLWVLIRGDHDIKGINVKPMPPAKHGLLPALMRIMRDNMDDPDVLIAACGVGNRIGKYDRIMSQVVNEHPLYPLGNEAIRRWRKTRPDVLEAAFMLIMRWSLFQPSAQHCVEDGVFTHVFDGLRRNKHKREIMSDGLMAIAYLSAPNSMPMKNYGGVELLVELMELHKDDPVVVGSGCIAISNLCMFPRNNVDLLIRAGLHEFVVERSLVLPLTERFARCCVRALMHFAGPLDASLLPRIIKSDLVDLVCRICYAFADADPPEQQLHATAFNCVDQLTKSTDTKSLTIKAGWHKKLVELADFEEVPKYSGRGKLFVNRQTQEWVVDVLGRWAVGDEGHRSELFAVNAHLLIGKILRYRPRDTQMVVKCTQTLSSMAVNGIYSTVLARDGVVDALSRILTWNSSNNDLHKHVLMCLASVALGDRKIKQTMADATVHEAALRCLRGMPHQPMPCMLSIVVLLRMVLDDGVLLDVAELEGLQDTVLDVVGSRYSMTQCAGENDLVNCGHTLLSNVYCGVVWREKKRRARPPAKVKQRPGEMPIYQRRYRPEQKTVYDLLIEDELRIQKDSGEALEPFPLSERPIIIQRLSGMALHACPNCRKGLASELIMTMRDLSPADYESLCVSCGWFRRGGVQLFQFRQMHAWPCNTSEIRLDLDRFDESKSVSFRRVRKRCERAGVRIRKVRPRYSEDAFQLYYRYQIERHESGFCSKESFSSHLLETPLVEVEENGIEYGTFHQEYFVGDHLAGVGVIDIMPHSLVSIYFFFDIDPKYARLSLGVYSCLKEIELARALNRCGADIQYYYLGNFCPSNKKLAYKADYQPAEVFCGHLNRSWVPHMPGQPADFFRDRPPSQENPSGMRRNQYTPHFVNDLPGARYDGESDLCSGIYRRIRVCVDGEQMSADQMFRRLQVHPMSTRKFRLTLIDLVQCLTEDQLQRIVLHISLIDGVLIYGDPNEIYKFE